nr:MAG TPA: hypothetical protein [Caudoviricetes sp.]
MKRIKKEVTGNNLSKEFEMSIFQFQFYFIIFLQIIQGGILCHIQDLHN